MSYKNSVEWIKVIRRISSEEFRVFPRTVKSDKRLCNFSCERDFPNSRVLEISGFSGNAGHILRNV